MTNVKHPVGINEKLIEELLKGYEKPEDIIGENGLLKQLTKAVATHRP